MESFAEIKQSMFAGEMDEADRAAVPPACIMIIDDDINVIEALTTLLQPRYRLISCLTFDEAKKRLTPDIKLVLLDIKMASKDGIEVFKLLKEKREDLRIIFHSAYPGSSERAAAVEQVSHDGYLTKGEYDLSELLTMIKETLNKAGEAGDPCFVRRTIEPKA